MIAEDFGLSVGALEDTEYVIASRTEDNATLFDIAQNALDETLGRKLSSMCSTIKSAS